MRRIQPFQQSQKIKTLITPKFHSWQLVYNRYWTNYISFKYLQIQFLIIYQMSTNYFSDSPLNFNGTIGVVLLSCLIGVIWAIINWLQIRKINLRNGVVKNSSDQNITDHQIELLLQIGEKISEGAIEFLKQQYLVCLIFIFLMFWLIFGAVQLGQHAYTSFSFLFGALTSIICGAIGMLIATYTNYRVTYEAKTGLAGAFRIAFRGGCVMGFALTSIALAVLIFLIMAFKKIMNLDDIISNADNKYFNFLFECIAGYGLGGSTVALFGRVGGGIYTKAADVGADLVGKLEKDLPQDSPKNPATIADNVGDNVGDIAGMGADLFGSFAESTCAALVISSNTLIGIDANGNILNYMNISNLMFPLILMALGIIGSLITSIIGIYFFRVDQQQKIENTLKWQIIISTFILCGLLYLSAWLTLPTSFYLIDISTTKVLYPWDAYICSILGLVSGMIIGGFTEYMTSHSYTPVRQVAESCKTGAATNIIYGLALGYLSTLIPVICIALTLYGSATLMGYYGIALAALGMLSNLPISLAIDGYGPISDNAGGIAEMSQMGEQVRRKTDALDAAGNTTAAIGKGFAIGSATLVAIALYGGFLHNSNLDQTSINLKQPTIYAGLLIGGMVPYIFSAFTMKSVGKAALGMVEEIRAQIKANPGILDGTVQPDYKACIRISTRASLIQMIAPGLLVILTPLVLGIAFGPQILAGFLPGSVISGVQLALSASNTGGAWDNAKKYIEAGNMKDQEGVVYRKGSDLHKAAVVGDTVGDPLKDTSGPSINILVKLMAILSLVFATLFLNIHKNDH